ncbi:MAG: glycosyltransferase family 39 protein [Anaerolineae bacterium]
MNTQKDILLRWGALALLLLFYTQVSFAARATSITLDEPLHIASGYTILRTGDYRLVEEHPPLVKMWMALPLLPLRDLPDPRTLPAWAEAAHPTTESLPLLHMAQQLLYPYQPTDRWLFPARMMSALLGVLMLAGVARFAGDLGGARGALFTVAFAAFDPNLLAHGAVAGTDLGATAFILLALFSAHRFMRRPTLHRAALTGVVLGLALAAKLTATLLGPALGIAGLWLVFHAKGRERQRLFWLGALVIGVTALTFWGIYGFQVGDVPGITFPIPAAAHAIPILRLREHAAGGHQAFLLGKNSMHGWWWYFPIAFALKTPLPVLLLAVVSCGVWVVQRGLRAEGYVSSATGCRICSSRIKHHVSRITHHASRITPGALALLLFALLYVVSSLLSPLNIGYRHLLPLLPFLYVGIGAQMANGEWQIANGESRIVHHASRLTLYFLPLVSCLLLLTWHIIGTLAVAPHFLTFFNEIAGGARQGWRYLADSNTDWGQGYKALARFQEKESIDSFHLSAFIFYDPAIYGVKYTALTPLGGDTPAVFPARFAPPPGDYVISTSPLNGIPLADPEMYDWFRWRAPDAQIANALHYYHVTADEVAVEWIAQCNVPVAPLDDTAIAEGFGRTGVRRVDFDCTQSWLIPGGDAPGRYVLHGAQLQDTLRARLHLTAPPAVDPFVARRLDALDIVYRQRAYRTEPAFAIYAPAGETSIPASGGWIARAETPPAAFQEQTPIAGPVEMDGPLTFLSAAAYRQKETIDVETWWLVSAAAPARPLSIMGHLLTTSGEVKGVADGLGIPVYAWQTGDILIQRHTFTLSAAEARADYVLRTGVYWLDDGTRWSIKTTTEADAFFIPFTLQ